MKQAGPLCQCGTPVSEHPYFLDNGWHFAVSMEEPVREPEQMKPRGLTEYRRLHPEANPLTTERITVTEFRKRNDGEQDEFERVVGIREVLKTATLCPRCARPMLDRGMHITCKPVDGSAPPERNPDNRLKRDDVPLNRRQPVIHTQADVITGANWFDALPGQTDDEVDEEEMADYVTPAVPAPVGDADPEIDPGELADFLSEYEQAQPSELGARLREEMEAERASRAVVTDEAPAVAAFPCPDCDRTFTRAAALGSHKRAHARKA